MLREILLSDPALVSSRPKLQDLISAPRKYQYVKVQVNEQLMQSIISYTCSEVVGIETDSYHAFGPKLMNVENFIHLGNLISDSGMLCIVDVEKAIEEDYEIDWREFVLSTMMTGSIRDQLEDFPFIKWYCSSSDGGPEYEIYGQRSPQEPTGFSALLIRPS